MPRITNEKMYGLLVDLKKSQDEFKISQDEMKISMGGFKSVQDKLALEVVSLRDWTVEKGIVINELREDVAYIRGIVEKDAKKQSDHEMEHKANIGAHDRFETRIKMLEMKKKN